MFRFARRLGYRDKVLGHLGALLLMYPRGRRFAEDHPGIPAFIRSQFDAGLSPASSALQLAARVIAGLLRQLDPSEKALVLERLRGLDRDALRAMAARRISAKPAKIPDRAAFAADMAALAIFMARRMTEEGALDQSDYRRFLADIETPFSSAPGGQAGATGSVSFGELFGVRGLSRECGSGPANSPGG